MLVEPKEASKIEINHIEIQTQIQEISVSGLVKEFNQQHTDNAGYPNSATLLDINEIHGMYILFFYFCSI